MPQLSSVAYLLDRQASGPSGPTLITPTNALMLLAGDSRTEEAIYSKPQGTFPAAFNRALLNNGMTHWMFSESSGKLQMGEEAHFGIGSGNTAQFLNNPRQASSGSVTTGKWWRGRFDDSPEASGSDNKGWAQINARSEGIVLFYFGVNDSPTTWNSTWQTNFTNLIGSISSTKLIVLFNEVPVGQTQTGGSTSPLSTGTPAQFKAASDWMKKFDYASGDALARSNVIVVDSWAATLDGSTGTNYRNIAGYKRSDGLHDTPVLAKKLASLAVARIAAALPSWYAALPTRYTTWTSSSVPIGGTDDFPTNNPVMIPGTNGTIGSGTWGTAPTAATIPQGWTVSVGSGATGLTCVCDKSTTDTDGQPLFKVTITGTLAATTTTTVTFKELFNFAHMTLSSKIRGSMQYKVDAGSQGLLAVWQDITILDNVVGAKSQNIGAGGQALLSALSSTNNALWKYPGNSLDCTQDSNFHTFCTTMMDCQKSEMLAVNGGPGGFGAFRTDQFSYNSANITLRNPTASSMTDVNVVVTFKGVMVERVDRTGWTN